MESGNQALCRRECVVSAPPALAKSGAAAVGGAGRRRAFDTRLAAGVLAAMRTMLRNVIGYRLLNRQSLDPLYVVWYVTLRCNLSCAFCDDGTGSKYPDVRQPEVGTDDALRILEMIRAACRSIYFTGGEPFVRKDFPLLVRRAGELGFWPILINTNLSLRKLHEETVRAADVLIVSLGSAVESNYDFVIRGQAGQTRVIMENLKRCAAWQEQGGPRVVVNCVISPGRIDDARSVFGFCRDHGLWFSPVPENRGVYVESSLLDDPEYQRLVREILQCKRQGGRVYSSQKALTILLRALPFQCYPTLAPRLYPNGDLFYPCHPLRQKAANLLEKDSFREAWDEGRSRYQAMPPCDNRCHLPCYVNNNQWMEHPLHMAWQNLRAAMASGLEARRDGVTCIKDG